MRILATITIAAIMAVMAGLWPGAGRLAQAAAPEGNTPAGKPPGGKAKAPASKPPIAKPPDSEAQAREAQEYEACLAQTDAATAHERASAWIAQGGGAPARHCKALALVRMGRAREGATALEELAQMLTKTRSPLVASVLDQAARAWLAANDATRADAVQTAALKLKPDDVDLLMGRAIILGVAHSYQKAIVDLDRILAQAPQHQDALVLRGAAQGALERFPAALRDLDAALTIDANHVDALLERGNLRYQTKDVAGARSDWLAALRLSPDGPVADAARANLERLDVKP